MTCLPRVIHLVDDTTAGGVMRVIDHILTSPDLAAQANHSLVHLPRGKISARVYKADLIVSHLSISWRNLPMLIAARAANASTPLVHIEHSYTENFTSSVILISRSYIDKHIFYSYTHIRNEMMIQAYH